MKILLQFPEGLKPGALEHVRQYKKKGNRVYLSGSKCFGGCDIAYDEAIALGIENIIHFGHSAFSITEDSSKRYAGYNIKVEYKEYSMDIDNGFVNTVVGFLTKNKIREIIVVTTVQHVHCIDMLKKKFEANGIKSFVYKGTRTTYPGQILGCDTSAAFPDAGEKDILYIGSGRFHYLAISKGLEKPRRKVIAANPFSKEIKIVNNEIDEYIRMRQGMIIKASECNVFGILVSTKIGQFNIKTAEMIEKRLIDHGKEAFIIVSNEFDWEALQNYNCIEAFINTACPRIADEWRKINKPIINTNELGLFFELIKKCDEKISSLSQNIENISHVQSQNKDIFLLESD